MKNKEFPRVWKRLKNSDTKAIVNMMFWLDCKNPWKMNIHVPQKPMEIFFFWGGVCPRTESIEKVSVKLMTQVLKYWKVGDVSFETIRMSEK